MADKNLGIKIEITDNSPDVLAGLKNAIGRALWAVGAAAEGNAKQAPGFPVDTGLLRNSITFAVGGSAPNISTYKADRPDKSGKIRTGSYGGTAPRGNHVLIGSNVEYAAAQENGTSRGIKPHHFLKNAVANHDAEYKALIKNSLENA